MFAKRQKNVFTVANIFQQVAYVSAFAQQMALLFLVKVWTNF